MQNTSRAQNITIAILSFCIGVLISYIVATAIAKHSQPVIPVNVPVVEQPQTIQGVTVSQDPGNPDQNSAAVPSLGISFNYLKYGWSYDENDHGINRGVLTTTPALVGDRLTFGTNGYLKVFTKAPNQSLETAISAQILSGISTQACIPFRIQADSDETVYSPVNGISYVRLNGNGCPKEFDFTNPTATFLSLSNQPGKFFYVVGDSDGTLPLLTSAGAPFWTTMTVK